MINIIKAGEIGTQKPGDYYVVYKESYIDDSDVYPENSKFNIGDKVTYRAKDIGIVTCVYKTEYEDYEPSPTYKYELDYCYTYFEYEISAYETANDILKRLVNG